MLRLSLAHYFKPPGGEFLSTIILAVDRRSCCWHWKIARGRSGRRIIRYMVELMFLVVIGPCHDTVTYLNQAYSVLYQSPSQAISVSL